MSTFQKEYWERKKLEKRRSPTHPTIKEYVIPRIEEIKKHFPIGKNTTVLDVGGGNGFFSYYFDKASDTTCIDYSEKMICLNLIKKKYVMDANDIKLPNNSFDVVFCHALLHHVDNIDRVIREMVRVSKKYVVILEPNRNNPFMFLFSLVIREENKALKFSCKYLKRKAEKNGLKVLSSFSYGLIVPNKTPVLLLPMLKLFNFKFPLGMTNFIIAEKIKESP